MNNQGGMGNLTNSGNQRVYMLRASNTEDMSFPIESRSPAGERCYEYSLNERMASCSDTYNTNMMSDMSEEAHEICT